jgi:hypothetical protein
MNQPLNSSTSQLINYFVKPLNYTPYPVPLIPGVLGRELLRHVLPENAYHKVVDDFQKVKKWVRTSE